MSHFNDFDPLGDDGMDGDDYQDYHGCSIPGCDCSDPYREDYSFEDDDEDDEEGD